MSRMTWLQERRMEKFDDVLGRFEAKRLSALDAAELLGMSERTFRRYRGRYEEDGLRRSVRPPAGQGVLAPGPGRSGGLGA